MSVFLVMALFLVAYLKGHMFAHLYSRRQREVSVERCVGRIKLARWGLIFALIGLVISFHDRDVFVYLGCVLLGSVCITIHTMLTLMIAVQKVRDGGAKGVEAEARRAEVLKAMRKDI